MADLVERLNDGIACFETVSIAGRYVPDIVGTIEMQREAAAEITRLRAALADAQAVGFAAGVEAVAKEIEGDDYNIGRAMSMAICCSGHECGCMGASVRDYLVYNIRAITPPDATAAAAMVLLGVWPTDVSFDAAFNACAASYHGGDQMQDVMDRTRATVSAALRAIAGDTP